MTRNDAKINLNPKQLCFFCAFSRISRAISEFLFVLVRLCNSPVQPTPLPLGTYQLENFRMRDPNLLVDEKTKTYYIISSNYSLNSVGFNSASIRLFSSKDLINWEGPHTIFQTPSDLWGDVKITGI